MDTMCERCEKKFVKKRKNQRFCNAECARRWRIDYRQQQIRERDYRADGKKKCRKCKKWKDPANGFHKNAYKYDGLQPVCKECANKKTARWSADNPRAKKDGDLRCRYNITEDEYQRLHKKQGGRCATCGRKPGKKRLHVDHNHKTKKVRGLLCSNCNLAIGLIMDNPKIAESIRKYLVSR